MSRRYTHIKEIEDEIFALKESGKTNRAIAEDFGQELKQVKWLINRHNKTERKKEYGILPKPKGRPRKDAFSQEEQKDRKIKQLEMENELLRDFLRLAGRR